MRGIDIAVLLLRPLKRDEDESYATQFIQGHTAILTGKDEEDLLEVPPSYTKHRIYEGIPGFVATIF